MDHFLYMLIPPRSTFDRDMSEDEQAIMGRHVAYWQEMAECGTAIAFGPVRDAAGAWGLAVVEAETMTEIRALGDEDTAASLIVRRGPARWPVRSGRR
jgi:uncharacterized protein YciI